jgi:hypothetical protein
MSANLDKTVGSMSKLEVLELDLCYSRTTLVMSKLNCDNLFVVLCKVRNTLKRLSITIHIADSKLERECSRLLVR